MSDEEDDATIQMDVSAIQEMYGDRARVEAEGPADDGTTQIDRAEIEALVAAERVEPARRKPDPTRMVDKRAIEMLQSRDEEHALAYRFERGEFSEFSEVSDVFEDEDEPRRLVPTLENAPVLTPTQAGGDTAPTSSPSPYSGQEPGRPPFSEAPTPGPGPGSTPAVRQAPSSPMTMPSSMSADLAPLLEPAPEISSNLDADALFGDLGPMTPMSPFGAPTLKEPTEDMTTSGLVMEPPAKRASAALPYVVGVLLVFAVAAAAFAAYVVTSGG